MHTAYSTALTAALVRCAERVEWPHARYGAPSWDAASRCRPTRGDPTLAPEASGCWQPDPACSRERRLKWNDDTCPRSGVPQLAALLGAGVRSRLQLCTGRMGLSFDPPSERSSAPTDAGHPFGDHSWGQANGKTRNWRQTLT